MSYVSVPALPLFSAPLPDFLNQTGDDFALNANRNVLEWGPFCVAFNDSIGTFNLSLAYIDEQVALAENQVTLAGEAGAEQVALAADQVTAASYQVSLAANFAAASEAGANIAMAASNLLGFWADLTGAIVAFSGVALYNNEQYIPIQDMADVTAVAPDSDPAKWFNYTASISAGEVVSSNTDVTGAKLVNVSWAKYRGMGGANDLTARTLTTPADVIAQGHITGLHDGFDLGIAGLADGSFGTLDIIAAGTDAAVAGVVSLRFTRGSQVWVRSSTNATTWASWERLRGESETLPVNRGGTNATSAATARTNLGAAASGAVATSGLTMATARVLGRTAGGSGAIEELTSSQLRSFADAAKKGAVGSSDLTMATARMLGRATAGSGPVEELDGAAVLAMLGLSGVRLYPSTVNWVSSNTIVRLVRLGTFVIAYVRLQVSGASTTETTYSTLIPAAYRPSVDQPTSSVILPETGGPGSLGFFSAKANGNLVFTRYEAYTGVGQTVVVWEV